MFAYGVCIGTEAKYEKFAKPGIARAVADGAMVFERRDQRSIYEAYESILVEVRETCETGLEGLILLHEDVEIRSPLDDTLRAEFASPDVAIVGAIGGRGVRGVRWDRSEITQGHAPDASHGENDRGRGAFDVDIVDGLLLALSPWAISNLHFDTATYSGFHGYDADICMQARSASRRVRAVELGLFHHTKGGFGDVASHRRIDDAFRKKWGIRREPLWYRVVQQLRRKVY